MEGIYRFFNCPIPVTGCNCRCDYCYIVQQGNERQLDFTKTKDIFKYSVEHMVKALDKERLGGVCAFHICGDGETFLWDEIVDFAVGLLKNGHYVSFTSNCTITKPLKQLVELSAEFRAKLFFKCSFHWREFKQRKLLNVFTANVNMLKAAGISHSVEVVTNDFVLDSLDELKNYSLEHFGALPHVLTQRDEENPGVYPRKSSVLSPEEYAKVWGAFNSDLFTYHQSTFDLKRKGYCYAGVYSLQFRMQNGDVYPCPGNRKKVVNLFEDIDIPPIFVPVGHNCPFSNCFFGFVTHILAGVDRKEKSPYHFRNFRDRICKDGTHWMSDTMYGVYGRRCSEFHKDYSPEKKFYLDMLMRAWYKGIEPETQEMEKLKEIVGKALRLAGMAKVAIYGMGDLGNWLNKVLQAAGINVPLTMDRKFTPPNTPIDGVDAVIITPYAQYGNIVSELRKKTSVPLISIVELVPDSE